MTEVREEAEGPKGLGVTGSAGLPPVAPDVWAAALDPLPARLRKRADATVAKAASWPVDVSRDGAGVVIRAVVRVDDDTTVTLTATAGVIATADDATCTCLLAPACLHRAAVLSLAPLAEAGAGAESVSEAEALADKDVADAEAPADMTGPETPAHSTPGPSNSTNSAPDPDPDLAVDPDPPKPHHPLTPPQLTASHTLLTATTEILVAGISGAGAVHRARLLHAAHAARIAGLHRASAAAVRVARLLGEAATGDPGFRLSGLTAELAELLGTTRTLTHPGTGDADPSLIGTARRPYRPERPLRLYGLFTEPVVTASGYAGVVTHALAPEGGLRTVPDVAPGGPERVGRAAGSAVPGARALSLRELGDGGGAILTAPTVSRDGRIGGGGKVRSVPAPGTTWHDDPLDALWQRAPHAQLTDALAWLDTPADERTTAGGDLLFLRGAVTAGGDLAVVDGPVLRLLAPDERPELPYAENLRLIAARHGLPVRVIGRAAPDRPGGILVLAAAWPGRDDTLYRADLGLRRLDRTHFPSQPPRAAEADPTATGPTEPPALPMELGVLRRAVDRAVAGGRAVAALDTGGELPRRLRAVGLATGAACAQRLTDAAADRRHDVLGRLLPADPRAYAEAWLATARYARAASTSLLTAAWEPRPPNPQEVPRNPQEVPTRRQ
ncbi:hypothetical protein [Streptomyces sp. NPDC087300]|uniref:hypothetical protein n=1 Tax=Streptomyces sp. NPDC087300 TaxID=3365780 RepID=UPI00380D9FB2